MRVLVVFPLFAVFGLVAACSATDRPLEGNSSTAHGGTTNMQNPQLVHNGGDAADLDAAPPLTDEELDRLLDALEQEIDKK